MVRKTGESRMDDIIAAAKSAADGERTIIEIDGMRVAIVSESDAEYLESLEDAEDIRDAEAILKRIDEPGATTPFDKFLKEFGLS
jgi:hypothetical protein